MSKVFNYRNVLVHLRKHVRKRLEQVADRVTERPAANLREWREAAASAQELVRLCKACLEPLDKEKTERACLRLECGLRLPGSVLILSFEC